MRARGHEFAIGLFVIAIGALLVGSVLFIYPNMPGDTRRILVRFPHDAGVAPIKEASPVLLGGSVQVGQVRRVSLESLVEESPTGPRRKLLIMVEADVAGALDLYRDCRITTDQPPVGGPGVLVILSVGTPDSGPLGNYAIAGLPAQSLAASVGSLSRFLFEPDGFLAKLDRAIDGAAEGSLMNKLLASLDDVNAITAEMRTQFNGKDQLTLLGKVQQMADNLNATTGALRQQMNAADEAAMLARMLSAMERVNQALEEARGILAENRPVVHNTVVNIDALASALQQQLSAVLRTEFNRDDPASILGKVHVSMDRLNASLGALAGASGTAENVLVVNKPLIEQTLRNVHDMSAQLKLASDEIRLAPWRLLYRPTERENAETTIFQAARNFAEAASSLDSAAARLAALQDAARSERSDAVPPEELRQMRAELQSAFEHFRTAEEFLFQQLK